MDFNSPETWRWIWLTMVVVFLVAETFGPATFFFLPFAIGAAVAALLSFLSVGVGWAWGIFFLVSLACFAGLWPLGRRLERGDAQRGVGATRWVGQEAVVVRAIDHLNLGRVRLQREIWRADSTAGEPIPIGTVVIVTAMIGTRLVVQPRPTSPSADSNLNPDPKPYFPDPNPDTNSSPDNPTNPDPVRGAPQ